MKLKGAFIRAIRSALQAFVAASGIGALAVLRDWADIKQLGISLALALVFALATFIVSFAQNVIEDNTSLSIPKDGPTA
jgi:hypothetical protein